MSFCSDPEQKFFERSPRYALEDLLVDQPSWAGARRSCHSMAPKVTGLIIVRVKANTDDPRRAERAAAYSERLAPCMLTAPSAYA